MVRIVEKWKAQVRRLRHESIALYYASRDPRTPWYARAIAGFVIAHALSPIDLIPDFIPVIGLLDDMIIVPLGIALIRKMIPPEVLEECRARAQTEGGKLVSWKGAAFIIVIWLALASWLILITARYVMKSH